MNYGNYDSNGNEKKFNFLDMFLDKKYRARLILFLYLVFFIIIIVVIRTGNISNNSVDTTNNDKIEDIQVEVNNEFFLKDEFSYIDSNNYNFNFLINYNNQEVSSVGKRFDNKFMFDVINDDNVANFIATGNLAKIKKDEEYSTTDYPYVLFNYYNNSVIENILSDSTFDNSTGLYIISNEKLFSYIDNNSSIVLSNKTANNSIELVKKNNKVVTIIFDLSNIAKEINAFESSLNIRLEYYNFNLVDDFEFNF